MFEMECDVKIYSKRVRRRILRTISLRKKAYKNGPEWFEGGEARLKGRYLVVLTRASKYWTE